MADASIQDKWKTFINAPPDAVFDFIETTPDKFPIYRLFETKPFFFLRMALVDGLRSALREVRVELPDTWILAIGEEYGPFTLIESERPSSYFFDLNSLFFKCQTGYSLRESNGGTIISFSLIADNPRRRERVYWFAFKPFHVLFAKKVLKVIKGRVEHQKN